MLNPFDLIIEKLDGLQTQFAEVVTKDTIQPPEIIDTKELCKRLNISEPTAIRMRKRKHLPCITIGSSIRFNWPTVVTALEGKKK